MKKILAIEDEFFTSELVGIATASAAELGATVDVRQWAFPTRSAQQEQMLLVERRGPAAVPVPEAFEAPFDHEILVLQFAPVSSTALERASRLQAILVNRAGVENIDVEAATAQGVPVFNTEGRNARAVAEFTVGLILAELRNIARSHTALKKGAWLDRFPNSDWTPELKDKLVGFAGYGRIGQLVREMLSGFGAHFQAFDPYVDPSAIDVPLVDLSTLMSTSDVISLHARLTPQSWHLIGEHELALAKPTAILVNTARSGLVDEQALAATLEEGRLGGAALDVYDREPASSSHPLIANERTTVTPHLAGTTVDGFVEGPRIVAQTLRRILAGDRKLRAVNHAALGHHT